MMVKKRALFVMGMLCLVSLFACTRQKDVVPTATVPEPRQEPAAYHRISAAEAKELLDTDAECILLDVRTPEEYWERRIDDAVLMPLAEIGARAATELPDKDALILVYCRTGVRSEAAAKELLEMGYTRVYDIGGIADWPYDTVTGEADTLGDGQDEEEERAMAVLLYQGHGSLRITTAEGMVIYVDPYAGDGYDLPADLILVTHQHGDHNKLSLIASRNPDCQIITEKEALKSGIHQAFDLGYVMAEAVEAGNKNHDPRQCVGYILTFRDGIQVYISGDTSKTTQMETFAERNLDYAFLCCDGIYNMGIAEASACAALIGARHSIPYHMAPGALFSRERAEQFDVAGRIILAPGEELTLW